MITANSGNGLSGNLSLLLGNGNGTFQSPVSLPGGITTSSAQSVIAADVNRDGKMDLVINGAVRLGNGTFQAPLVFATTFAPNTVRSADVNGDGVLDPITANGGNHTDQP